MNRIKFPLAGVVTAVLATAVMVPCVADTVTNDRIEMSAQVNASDLNLADRRDVAKLKQRVWRAAQSVCTQIAERNPAMVDVDDVVDRANCVQNAVADAMPQVRVAAVAAQVRAGEAVTSRPD